MIHDQSAAPLLTSDDRIDEICDVYEAAWRCGQRPKIASFLDRSSDAERPALFCELLLMELEYRQKLGEQPSRHEYLKLFPEFADQIEAVGFKHGLDAGLNSSAEIANTHSTSSAAPGTRIGQFELLELLGTGAAGEVWKARDSRLQRMVAIKIPRSRNLSDAELHRFLREGRAAAQLHHSGIVPVHDVDRHGDTAFIVSEYIAGENLRNRLARGRFSFKAAAELCAKLAEALHHAHEQGIVHRDLKPANVLVDDDDEPHITDFGLAKWTNDARDLTLEGQLLGTVAYMAPEQARGDVGKVDRRTDVYAIGVLLYEMLSGHCPFGGDEAAVIHAITHDEPRPPRKLERHIPRDLETICMKSLEKEPSHRYPSAQEMAVDLRRYLRGEPILARRVTLFERSWRWIRRRPAVAASIALAFLTVGSIAVADRFAEKNHELLGLRAVAVTTDPPGAELTIVPLSESTGEPLSDQLIHVPGRSPVKEELKPGDYLVVAVLNDQRFHEVYRHVPRNDETMPGLYNHQFWTEEAGHIVWPSITIPPLSALKTMIHVDGCDRFSVGFVGSHFEPAHERRIRAFYIDVNEFSYGDCLNLNQGRLPPSARDGSSNLQELLPVSFDHAMAYAEEMGKRLPTEFELDCAAAKLPAEESSDPSTLSHPANEGRAVLAVTDSLRIRRGVGEWTTSWPNPYPPYSPTLNGSNVSRIDYRIVLRYRDKTDFSTSEQHEIDPNRRIMAFKHSEDKSIAFRCVRSEHPRVQPADFSDNVVVGDAIRHELGAENIQHTSNGATHGGMP